MPAAAKVPDPDCWTCQHSDGCDAETAKRKIEQEGYSMGRGDYRFGVGLVCTVHRVVAPMASETCGYDWIGNKNVATRS